MTFSEYLISKNIDEKSFSSQDSNTFLAWKNLFEQVSPSSFTDQKKFKINPIRRKYLLKTEK
jgi:hypothetical protein